MDESSASTLQPRTPLQTGTSNSSGGEARPSERAQLLLEITVVLMYCIEESVESNLCLCVCVGNVLVIVIVAATKSLHSMTSVLITNLAISDLLVGIGVMPFVALSVLNPGWVHCAVSHPCPRCLVYLTFASALTLAAIALDRFYSITDCLRYSSRCTPWRTCAVVTWIWLQALATCSPPLLGWSSVSFVLPMYICAVDWSKSPSYTAFIAAFSYFIPASVIVFCYLNIVKHRKDPSSDSSHHVRSLQCPWRVFVHVDEELASHGRAEQRNTITDCSEATTQQSSSPSRRLFSFLLHPTSRKSSHHGVVHLLLVISAFLLCWTPYISVALVQAAEAATSGQSTLVPHSAITFSYWLVLLNSDINPLLYALLSRRFQSGLRGLCLRLRAQLESVLGSEEAVRAEDVRGSDSYTQTSARLSPHSSTESLTFDPFRYSSIFTVSGSFTRSSGKHLCHVKRCESTSVVQHARRAKRDNLQVSIQPREGSRLPSSALTEERQATFVFGQITVKVEHDVC
uniref:G-protein coupled receptors family 1 profile domain-containing protein n=1 Tax=Oryzias sinensis TaxID=183150 RepID=A0A8C7X242_9TELE